MHRGPLQQRRRLIIFGEASSRDDGIVALADRLKGRAGTASVEKLLKAKLIEEIKAAPKMPVWRRDESEGAAPCALRPLA